METKTCKHCKEQIAKDAKRCPKCGGKQGISGCLIALFIVIGIVILLGGCTVACTGAFVGSVDQAAKEKEKIKCTVEKQYLGSGGYGYYIEGSCVNNSSKDYSYLQIEFICYDKAGNNLGSALDNTNNLLAGQTWKFKALDLASESKDIDHCDYHEVTGW